MRLVLEWGFSWTHSWGWSLVLLSLAVNTAILPIYNWAERRQEEERALRRRMARHEAMLRRAFRGQKRFALLSALRRQYGYGYGFTFRASVGLLLQIPFFFAAYHLLSHFPSLNGQSFGVLSDLGAADALFSPGGFTVNLLPILMTLVNLASAFVYTTGLTRRDRLQIYGMALVFLVLLYNAASALTLYWTLNNVYSLGKNIVEKDWMRRPAWQAFWAACRSALPCPGVRGGAFEHFWTGLFDAARCTIGVGALFWLYTGTAALARHAGPPDAGFMAAMARFGWQCIAVAVAASLVLAAFAPRFSPRRRGGRHWLFPAACAALLFLFQARWLQAGLAVEQGRFPFDLWDGGGGLAFALWASAVYGIGRFGERLAGMAGAAAGRALAALHPVPADAETQAVQAEPSLGGTFTLSCLLGGACGLFLWGFMPFCTYFQNTNEFDFNAWELLTSLTPWCLATAAGASLLLFASTWALPWERVHLPRVLGASACRLNVLHCVVMTLLGLLWLEGTVLSYGLPKFNGDERLFSSPLRMAVDGMILVDLFLLGLWTWRRTFRRIFLMLGIFSLLCAASLADARRGGEERVEARNIQGVKGLRLADRDVFYSRLRFSNTHNIIILLFDSLDTLAFEKTLELHPELRDVFDGFWLFRENLGPGGLTLFALPQILSGRTYSGKEYSEFVQESLVGEHSIAADALRNKYRVFIETDSFRVLSDNDAANIRLKKHDICIPCIFTELIFRFIPYYGKHLLENDLNIKGYELETEESEQLDKNKKVFRLLVKQLTSHDIVDDHVIQFIYFFGVHMPYIKKDIINTTKELSQDLSDFIEHLKNRGIYDKTTLVVMADHGYTDHRKFYPERNIAQPTFLFPLLMLKMPSSTGELEIHDDLTSSTDLKHLLHFCYNHGFTNRSMEQFLKGKSPVRTYYDRRDGKMEARGTSASLSLKKAK